MGKLTALGVKTAKPGRHADGDGLYLLVKPSGARSWVLRVQSDGKRRDVGLGGVEMSSRVTLKPTDEDPLPVPLLHRRILTLAEAREKSGLLRGAAKAGMDPIAERDRERTSVPTFAKAAAAAHQALKDGWADKGANTFIRSLETHAYPAMGTIRVDKITSADITTALTPIWTSKPDMARKVRQRIGTVLNFAHGKGWRPTEAPGRSVTVGLPRQPKGGNYEAMPYADVPSFVADLVAAPPTTGRAALLFLIFTAARPGEVRRAAWGQIDDAKADWNRPSSIMKGIDAPPHTVTLNSAALAVLSDRRPSSAKADTLIFGNTAGGMISDMTMNKVLRTAGLSYDAHAFRSSFRDWAAEKMPEIPDPVAEAAIAHVVPDKVVRAYKRTVFLEMRRKLLEAWGKFVMGGADAG
ncbi:MAG: integrase arm-type DNA-binding domain-containing protein [Sphingomonas bacterium]|nr:integrase arm-type DNA-binding domain-containing protein [Sphingomonas bacterium]